MSPVYPYMIHHNEKFDPKLMLNTQYGRFGFNERIAVNDQTGKNIEVFLDGVLQQEGVDYVQQNGEINMGSSMMRDDSENLAQLQIRSISNGYIVYVRRAKTTLVRSKVGTKQQLDSEILIDNGEYCFYSVAEMNKFIANYYK